jgi:probable HAF family extracellular repeat protein
MKTKENWIIRLAPGFAVLLLIGLKTLSGYAQLGAGYIRIDVPNAKSTSASGINDHGKIVGTYHDAAGLGHGFLRSEDGEFTTIDHPLASQVNGFGTEARGINAAGVIVGDYCAAPPCDGVSVIKGYVLERTADDRWDPDGPFDKDDFKTLQTPHHVNSYLQRINSERDIVGCEHDTDTQKTMHGIVRDDGRVQRLAVPFSMNNGINTWGDIDGFYFDTVANRAHGYLLRKGVPMLIDFPGANSTLAWDINDRGQIVGFYDSKGVSPRGFIWDDGRFTSVEIPGALATFVFGINSGGEIVGEFDDAAGAHGFLLRTKPDEKE